MRCCPYKGLSLFWLETEISILDGPSMLVQFIDWVAQDESEVVFCTFLIALVLFEG